MADDLKKAEGRAYAKGYAAGRSRVQREIDEQIRMQSERAEFVTLYAAIFTGCVQNGAWRTGEIRWTNGDDYARGCAAIADSALHELRTRYGR